jgi:WD40 repeat protein
MKAFVRLGLIASVIGMPLWAAGQTPPQASPAIPIFATGLGQNTRTWSILLLLPEQGIIEWITDDTYDEIVPLASYDGRYVVFLRGDVRQIEAMEYYVLDRECSGDCDPIPLPAESRGLQHLRWSPDDYRLAGWGGDMADIWLIDIPSNTIKNLTNDGIWDAFPAWSPDGKSLIITSDAVPAGAKISDDIQLLSVAGGERINLTYSGEFVEDKQAVWSPNGRWIAYIAQNVMDSPDPLGIGAASLIVIEAKCTLEKQPAPACLKTRHRLTEVDQAVIEFAWSPDSRYLAYVAGVPFSTVGDVWLVEIETGETTQLTTGGEDSYLTWAPDGAALLFERGGENSLDVMIVPVNRSFEAGKILEGFLATANPYWSPVH